MRHAASSYLRSVCHLLNVAARRGSPQLPQMVAPPHRPIASSKSSAPQLKSRRITAARPLIWLLLLCAARQAHAVSSPAVPDHSQRGAPEISDARSVGRGLSEATCVDLDDGATDNNIIRGNVPNGNVGCSAYRKDWCGNYDDTDFSANAMCCACGGGLAPPPPPPPPALPPRPPVGPTAVSDWKFGCGSPGPHVSEPMTTGALMTAVDAASVTCIKLAPITYAITSRLIVAKTLAIVAEQGPATLDGGGSVRFMIYIKPLSGADVALANLVLRNASEHAIYNYGGIMAVKTCVFEHNKAPFVRLRRPS